MKVFYQSENEEWESRMAQRYEIHRDTKGHTVSTVSQEYDLTKRTDWMVSKVRKSQTISVITSDLFRKYSFYF